jgi:polar amino acid transport system permease protein
MDVLYTTPKPDAVTSPLASTRPVTAITLRKLAALVAFAVGISLVSTGSFAQAAAQKATVLEALLRWAPLLLWGFAFNLLISAGAMLCGTMVGVFVGIGQMSRIAIVRIAAKVITEVFRNSPWLVVLFACILLLPFKIHIFGLVIPFPDWAKAIFGFSLPVLANTSEIVRGAVMSVPTGQWESAESLGYSRSQAYAHVILPQCVRRMLPPWMNLYSLVTMATVYSALIGVSEMLTLTSQVLAAEGSRPDFLAPFYGFVLVCFFLYCYPIGKWTQYLERKYQVRA